MVMKTHKTLGGKLIPINELEDSHLINIIKFYQKKAKEGLLVSCRSPGLNNGMDDHYFDIVYGEEALEILGYSHYIEEAKSRFNNFN